MLLAIKLFGGGLLLSGLLYWWILRSAPKFWSQPTSYATERVEKTCDSVTSFVSFLIPATLAVTTWVYEKTKTPWYGALLALGTIWFLVVLGRTMYVRFNFVWRLPTTFKMGGGQNMEVARWLTTVMVGLTVGLLSLSIPTFSIAFRTAPEKEKPHEIQPQVHYEYHIDQTQPCRPCPAPGAPVPKQAPVPESGPKPNTES